MDLYSRVTPRLVTHSKIEFPGNSSASNSDRSCPLLAFYPFTLPSYDYFMNRRLIALLSALALPFTTIPASLATDLDDQKILEMKQHGDGGWIGMNFENANDDLLPSRGDARNAKKGAISNQSLGSTSLS